MQSGNPNSAMNNTVFYEKKERKCLLHEHIIAIQKRDYTLVQVAKPLCLKAMLNLTVDVAGQVLMLQ